MPFAPWQQAAILAGLTFAAFAPSLAAGLVYDARLQILTDGFIHDAGNWPAVLTGRVLARDVLDFNRPAHLASLMADAAIWGRHPLGYHLTSILLHVANTLLLWALIRRFVAPRPPLVPLAAAGLFALHPVVTEAVCEPSYREDLLVAFFSLVGLVLAMGHGRRGPDRGAVGANRPPRDGAAGGVGKTPPARGAASRDRSSASFADGGSVKDALHGQTDLWRAAACGLSCLLAIAAKETGIAAPMLLTVYWVLFRRGEPARFWLIAAGGGKALVLTFVAARLLLAPAASRIFVERPGYPGGSLSSALLLEPRILALYAQLVVWPANLCADYGLLSLQHVSLATSLVVLVGIAIAATLAARSDRRLLLAWCLIVFPLLPVLNLVPIYRPAADRYLYLPLTGVAVAVACLLDSAWLARHPSARRCGLAGCIVAAALLGIACVGRQTVWADSLALWDDSFRKNPGSPTAASGLGEALREAGRLGEAEQATRQAIRLSGGRRGDLLATLALILDEQGRATEASEALAAGIALEPRLADPDGLVATLAMERPMAEDLKNLIARRPGPPPRSGPRDAEADPDGRTNWRPAPKAAY